MLYLCVFVCLLVYMVHGHSSITQTHSDAVNILLMNFKSDIHSQVTLVLFCSSLTPGKKLAECSAVFTRPSLGHV